jgi:hypothetical protein
MTVWFMFMLERWFCRLDRLNRSNTWHQGFPMTVWFMFMLERWFCGLLERWFCGLLERWFCRLDRHTWHQGLGLC